MAIINMKKIQSDLLAMNVTWFIEDLELYDGQYGFYESFCFTVARLVTLILAIIVHRAFYKLMKRLPGRAVNQIIYPSMVRFQFFYWQLVSRNIFASSDDSKVHKFISLIHQLFSVILMFTFAFFFRF